MPSDQIIAPALQGARTAIRVLSKLSGITLLQSFEVEEQGVDGLPIMVTKATVAVKGMGKAAARDIYASPEAFTAAILNPSTTEAETHYVVELILSKPADDSIVAQGQDGQQATQLMKAKVLGQLTAVRLDAIQSCISRHQAAPIYAVNNLAVVRAPIESPTEEEISNQIEQSMKPPPAGASTETIRELVQYASSMKVPSEGLAFFLRELPFSIQQ
jgi:hypothetical protein